MKYSAAIKDNKLILLRELQRTPLPDFPDDGKITEIVAEIPKKVFIECYNKWIKESDTVDIITEKE